MEAPENEHILDQDGLVALKKKIERQKKQFEEIVKEIGKDGDLFEKLDKQVHKMSSLQPKWCSIETSVANLTQFNCTIQN